MIQMRVGNLYLQKKTFMKIHKGGKSRPGENVHLEFSLRGLTHRGNLDHHFARVHSLVQIDQSLGRTLDTTGDDVLLTLELALRQPGGQLLQRRRVFLRIVEDDEALHGDSLRLDEMLEKESILDSL